MDRVIEVDASENSEDIGLQERDEKFERGQSHCHRKRKRCEDHGPSTRSEQHGNEAAEHFERDVARKHVGEETNRKTDRPRDEGNDLDQHEQRQQNRRNA